LTKNSIAIKNKSQDILTGSSKLTDKSSIFFDRINFAVDNMQFNKAYTEFLKVNKTRDLSGDHLESFKKKYINYRESWTKQIEECTSKNLSGPDMIKNNLIPLCIDIEVASVCDLACPHCYREYIATPDKIMSMSLFKKIIDQASKLQVPSVKLNWRGEPLLNPKLPEMINYAKCRGILEVIINTNATKLDSKTSKKLIEAGLDLIIFSFDGGTKETYEKYRPGRFNKNNFESVYNNIKKFSQIRSSLKSKFPVTKIQMVLTKESRGEKSSFFGLFKNYVDDVTVTQYTERGGDVKDLSSASRSRYLEICNKKNIPVGAPYLLDIDDSIYISKGRLSCLQPFQRLLITYDGRVSMCCYDWGAMHPVGYVSDSCFDDEDKDKIEVINQVKTNKKGFELLQNIKMPKKYNKPKKITQTISEIWEGKEIETVRLNQINNSLEKTEICRNCTFKDTYDWISD